MLFNFGTEISVFSKICKWWRWGGGGTLRRRCCVSSFLNCYFSDRIYQNGVRHSFNFHFSLLISKKRSKNGVKTLVWMIAPPPPCKNVAWFYQVFCPCQLGSAVEIRLWEWYKLQNKNFHVGIVLIQIQPQTRLFSCVVELLAREHEIIRLAAFV